MHLLVNHNTYVFYNSCEYFPYNLLCTYIGKFWARLKYFVIYKIRLHVKQIDTETDNQVSMKSFKDNPPSRLYT